MPLGSEPASGWQDLRYAVDGRYAGAGRSRGWRQLREDLSREVRPNEHGDDKRNDARHLALRAAYLQ
jgi:hypothetical protein